MTQPATTGCDLRITFGSFATGIDRDASAAVERLVGSDASVTRVTRSPYGPEGEYSICVRTGSKEAAARLLDALRQTLSEPVEAPVTVSGPGGSFSIPTRS